MSDSENTEDLMEDTDLMDGNDVEGLHEELTTRRRCHAKSKQSGQRCKRTAILGGTVCFTHGGNAPQVKRKGLERIFEFVEPALTELYKIVVDKKTPANTKVVAIKDILDRAGFGAAQKIEADIHVFDTREELDHEIDEILEAAQARMNDSAAN